MDRIRLLMLLVVALAGCSEILGLRDVRVVVDGSPPCQEGLDVLLNGGFEDQTSAWISDPEHSYFCPADVIPPPDGMWSGCLGVTGASVETMSQKVSLPSGVKTLTLSGSICIATQE